MKYQTITLEKKKNIATITLNRPEKLNVLTPQMGEELVDVFGAVDRDEETRVVIIAGAGRAFCAGADIDKWFLPLARERRKGVEKGERKREGEERPIRRRVLLG